MSISPSAQVNDIGNATIVLANKRSHKNAWWFINMVVMCYWFYEKFINSRNKHKNHQNHYNTNQTGIPFAGNQGHYRIHQDKEHTCH
ncbi:MAG: hypothetical protein V4577_19885 [Bacteroidota bacterium]